MFGRIVSVFNNDQTLQAVHAIQAGMSVPVMSSSVVCHKSVFECLHGSNITGADTSSAIRIGLTGHEVSVIMDGHGLAWRHVDPGDMDRVTNVGADFWTWHRSSRAVGLFRTPAWA